MARRGAGGCVEGGCVEGRLAALDTAEESERVGGRRAAEEGGADGRRERQGDSDEAGTCWAAACSSTRAREHGTCRLMSRRMLRWPSCHVPWAIMSPVMSPGPSCPLSCPLGHHVPCHVPWAIMSPVMSPGPSRHHDTPVRSESLGPPGRPGHLCAWAGSARTGCLGV